MQSNYCIVFLTHILRSDIIDRFNLIYKSMHDKCDVFLAIHSDIERRKNVVEYKNTYWFSLKDLHSLGYRPHGGTLMHNTNYMMQKFRKDHPNYDYYWFVEYDVVFRGEWNVLFDYYADKGYDFIASHIEFKTEKNKDWFWWDKTNWNHVALPKRVVLKSFDPICRYSGRALDFLDGFLKKGMCGHFENILATALHNYNYSLCDMGKGYPFSEKESDATVYFYDPEKGVNNGTIRWRPEFTMDDVKNYEKENILFHPVK